MGGQITTIQQGEVEQQQHSDHKQYHHAQHQAQKPVFEFRRVNEVPRLLQQFKWQQTKFDCKRRAEIIQQMVKAYDDQFQREHPSKDPKQIYQKYLQTFLHPSLKNHENNCYACTGRHWEVEEWNMQYSQVSVEEGNHYQMLKFTITNPAEKTDHLDVIIYKYFRPGNAYLKEDKVRNMKIYKKPLSKWQLTNLVFQHQYLVVQCQNSYWSFQKDSKRLIVQASLLLADVRDRILGQERIEQMSFTWFGLRKKWFPEVMYESNDITAKDIKEVRTFAQNIKQKQLKYNLFTANCKIYAQHIMKNSVSDSSWKENQTFFDFFNA